MAIVVLLQKNFSIPFWMNSTIARKKEPRFRRCRSVDGIKTNIDWHVEPTRKSACEAHLVPDEGNAQRCAKNKKESAAAAFIAKGPAPGGTVRLDS